ncbi:MAG: precorrin-3B C(17)-methyltransferase [bacterium]
MYAENKTVILYISNNGRNLAQRIKGLYPDAQILKFQSAAVSEIWNECKNLIFIMACGIVVRTIAPLIKDKKTDPAVVVLDEKGKFVISLLSGHLGGANKTARNIAKFLDGQAVITTASDVHNISHSNLVIGIGCNRGTSENEIEKAVRKTLAKHNLSFADVISIATIDIKSLEPGLVAFAQIYNLLTQTFSTDELNSVKGILKSESVFKSTGAIGVAEPAALLASKANKLLIPKQKIRNVTIAVAEHKTEEKGEIYIVGVGPGDSEHITPYAQKKIRSSEVIVGYNSYINLIAELIKDKEIISTGMTQELKRCQKAVELAIAGKTVSVISGGDPGIYAMAGLVFEIIKKQNLPEINIEVVPGISALNASAARLGAPLMHDFAVISLSDRLTPWELIKRRLESAAMSDFVIVFYNPRSIGRQKQINKAREIILKYRTPETPVGIVKGAMRDNEKIIVTNLKDMLDYEIDMQTTIIIGNSQTFLWNNRMITPRGYEVPFYSHQNLT